MAYTPELDMDESAALRRVAWALGLPMTKAMSCVINFAVEKIDSRRVCVACRDRSKCSTCPFNNGGEND